MFSHAFPSSRSSPASTNCSKTSGPSGRASAASARSSEAEQLRRNSSTECEENNAAFMLLSSSSMSIVHSSVSSLCVRTPSPNLTENSKLFHSNLYSNHFESFFSWIWCLVVCRQDSLAFEASTLATSLWRSPRQDTHTVPTWQCAPKIPGRSLDTSETDFGRIGNVDLK